MPFALGIIVGVAATIVTSMIVAINKDADKDKDDKDS